MIKNPQVGDIVRVRATDAPSNLVVLWDTSRPKYVQGILLHTSPELATDMDVVLARRAEGRYGTIYPGTVTPYPLVLCCDLYGQFLRTQVDKHVAHIDNFPVSHPLLNPDEIAEALGGWRGLPIFRGTPRWDEKVRLLEEELRPLTRPFWEGFRW
jgi:hypothetical protein